MRWKSLLIGLSVVAPSYDRLCQISSASERSSHVQDCWESLPPYKSPYQELFTFERDQSLILQSTGLLTQPSPH